MQTCSFLIGSGDGVDTPEYVEVGVKARLMMLNLGWVYHGTGGGGRAEFMAASSAAAGWMLLVSTDVSIAGNDEVDGMSSGKSSKRSRKLAVTVKEEWRERDLRESLIVISFAKLGGERVAGGSGYLQ